MRQTSIKIGLCALAVILPSFALAHSGHEHSSSFMSGLTHPLTGLDHLLAMVAIGLWAKSLGGKSLWSVPLAFVLTMFIGAVFAINGLQVPYVESGILLSVIMLGALVLSAKHLPVIVSMSIAGTFAFFHGAAHGMEMPLDSNAIQYSVGFALSTVALHLSGIGLGQVINRFNIPSINRLAGAAISVSGVFLALT